MLAGKSRCLQLNQWDGVYMLLCGIAGVWQAWCLNYGRNSMFVDIFWSVPFVLVSYVHALLLKKAGIVDDRPDWWRVLVLWAGMWISLFVFSLTAIIGTQTMSAFYHTADNLPLFDLRVLIAEAAGSIVWAACLLIWSGRRGHRLSLRFLPALFAALFAGVLFAWGLAALVLRNITQRYVTCFDFDDCHDDISSDIDNSEEQQNRAMCWSHKQGAALDETNLQGNLTNEYVFFGGKRIARRDASGNVFYYVADHLGSSREIVQAGQTSACYDADFFPYGGEIAPYVNSCPQDYKFTGKERDAESGLDNFGARYNSSQLGRFMSPDPLGGHLVDPQTLNKYVYVRDNPVSLTDPTGLDLWLKGCGKDTATCHKNYGGWPGSGGAPCLASAKRGAFSVPSLSTSRYVIDVDQGCSSP